MAAAAAETKAEIAVTEIKDDRIEKCLLAAEKWDLTTKENCDLAAQEACWILVGDPNASFYWGLLQNLQQIQKQQEKPLKVQLQAQFKWIISRVPVMTSMPSSKIQVLHQDFKGVHRKGAGWQAAVDVILNVVTSASASGELLIDTYCDKTFGWCQRFYKHIGLIPYQKSWIGFLHHTLSEAQGPYNLSSMFFAADSVFVESLKFCKGLIVLSNSLKQTLLKNSKISDLLLQLKIPIFVLVHPTEIRNHKLVLWQPEPHEKQRKLVHVGAWLRDPLAIYLLELPRHNRLINKKAILCAKNSSGYRPTTNFIEQLQKDSKNMVTLNHWDRALANWLVQKIEQVEVIPTVDDETYDLLLSEHVIFVPLVTNPSAVNTLIECAVRNSPVLTPRFPASEEILGEKYPLFYDSLEEASEKLASSTFVNLAHMYLKEKLNKSKFSFEHFAVEFDAVLQSVFLSL